MADAPLDDPQLLRRLAKFAALCWLNVSGGNTLDGQGVHTLLEECGLLRDEVATAEDAESSGGSVQPGDPIESVLAEVWELAKDVTLN